MRNQKACKPQHITTKRTRRAASRTPPHPLPTPPTTRHFAKSTRQFKQPNHMTTTTIFNKDIIQSPLITPQLAQIHATPTQRLFALRNHFLQQMATPTQPHRHFSTIKLDSHLDNKSNALRKKAFTYPEQQQVDEKNLLVYKNQPIPRTTGFGWGSEKKNKAPIKHTFNSSIAHEDSEYSESDDHDDKPNTPYDEEQSSEDGLNENKLDENDTTTVKTSSGDHGSEPEEEEEDCILGKPKKIHEYPEGSRFFIIRGPGFEEEVDEPPPEIDENGRKYNQVAPPFIMLADGTKMYRDDWNDLSPQDRELVMSLQMYIEDCPTPATGTPGVVYEYGFKPLFAIDHPWTDKQGRQLPINYATHHYHDPYDYFSWDTSTIFSPPLQYYQYNDDFEDEFRRDAYRHVTFQNEVLNFRATIMDPEELHAFDHTFTALLVPDFFADFISKDDPRLPYSDRHPVWETLNHPDPEQSYMPNTGEGPHSWTEFFSYDIRYAPRDVKWATIGSFATLFGFSGLLAGDAIMAMEQFFYDIEHAHNH